MSVARDNRRRKARARRRMRSWRRAWWTLGTRQHRRAVRVAFERLTRAKPSTVYLAHITRGCEMPILVLDSNAGMTAPP